MRHNPIWRNEYLVMGTVERSFWLRTLKEPVEPKTTFANLHVFKKVVSFELQRPHWALPNSDREQET